MELSELFKSGIITNSPEFDRLASEAARTHNMPFFEDLQGESEATLEDVKMTPKNLSRKKLTCLSRYDKKYRRMK